ncbi:hypothetical protein TNCV_2496371 [Trichonephila clavipes]|nr:hypothetical protein TNCV_2496371 [Trichonephila clavipes]
MREAFKPRMKGENSRNRMRMKGENSRNRMRENLIKRTPRQNGEGGRAPKHDRSIEAERRRGEGKNAGRQSGRLRAVNQGSDQARQEPSIKDAVQGSEGSVVNRV